MMTRQEKRFPFCRQPLEMFIRISPKSREKLPFSIPIEEHRLADVIMFAANRRNQRIHWFSVPTKIDPKQVLASELLDLCKEMLNGRNRLTYLNTENHSFCRH